MSQSIGLMTKILTTTRHGILTPEHFRNVLKQSHVSRDIRVTAWDPFWYSHISDMTA